MHNSYSATVISTRTSSGALAEDFKNLNINIITQKVGYFNMYSYWKLYRTLKKNNFDTVCDFTGDFGALVLFVSKLAGIKNRIVFYRNSSYTFKMNLLKRLYLKFLKFILRHSATKILSNSQTALETFHPDWKKQSNISFKVIKNGVPYNSLSQDFNKNKLKTDLGIPNNYFVIGNISSFRKQKNHLLIVQVAKAIVNEYSNIRFMLVGKGVAEGLEDILKKEKMEGYFIMPGIRKDIIELLNIMDAFIFPSRIEGQPNALIEAMIYKVPIFASNILPIEECTPEAIKGNLFSPNDYKAYANAIKKFLNERKTYNLEKVSMWAKEEFDPQLRFNEFLKEL